MFLLNSEEDNSTSQAGLGKHESSLILMMFSMRR